MLEIIVILLACLLLLLPIKGNAWRKIRPVIAVLALSFLIAPMIPGTNDRINVRVQALNQKDEAAEGTEVRLEAVSFDGVAQDITSLFPGNKWSLIGGRLTWRSFDTNSETTIYDQWPPADEYEITFQKAKWRGFVEVQIGNEIHVIDCYAPVEYGQSETITVKAPAKTGLLTKALNYGVFALALVLICLLLPLLLRSSRKETRDPGAVTRESWSDILRMLSIFLIVLVGSSGRPFELHGIQPPSGMTHLLLYAFESLAFPVFFMLTGAFLMYRDEEPMDTLTKRVPSVLVPLIGLIAITFLSSGFFVSGQAEAPPVAYVFNSLFDTYDATPRFLLILVVLYLLAPVFRPIFVHAGKSTRSYTICFLYLLPSIACTALSFLGQEGLLFTCATLLSFLGQFLFGAYMIASRDKHERKWLVPGIVMLIGYGLTVGLRYFIATGSGVPLPTPMAAGVESMLFSGGIFALFMSLAPLLEKLPLRLRLFIKHISSLAIGILMIHSVLMRRMPIIAVEGFTLQMNSATLWNSVLMGVIYLVLALAISYIISTVPVFKRIIGLDWYSASSKDKSA